MYYLYKFMRVREIKYILQNMRHAWRDRRPGENKVIDMRKV